MRSIGIVHTILETAPSIIGPHIFPTIPNTIAIDVVVPVKGGAIHNTHVKKPHIPAENSIPRLECSSGSITNVVTC